MKKAKNEETEGFPRELLKQPKAKWLEYYLSYGVQHPVFADAFRKLMRFVLGKTSKSLAFIIGPTGSGKTFLRECMEENLSEMTAVDPNWNPGRIPHVSVEVPGKDTTKPSFADLYVRQLRALCEPESLIGKKIIYGDLSLNFDHHGHLTFGRGATTRKYRYALEQALIHRDPFVVSYEEAQHLLDFAGLSFQELTDCVKSIANMTRKRHALYGNYEMRSLMDQSDQLMRRSVIIHLRRYGTGKADQALFGSTIFNFQLNMPFPDTPNLLRHRDYLYSRTAGNVGMLSDWLREAYTEALDEPKVTTIRLRHLESTAPFSARRAGKMLKEIEKQERAFLEDFGEEADETLWAESKGSEGVEEGADEKPSLETKRRSGPVGRRKPGRDDNGMCGRYAA